jgi:hypothetical protein
MIEGEFDMSKYGPLCDYLVINKASYVKLTYPEIEKVINDQLPKSASNYREWWANGSHIQANAWLDAGYKVDKVALGQYVEFIKSK